MKENYFSYDLETAGRITEHGKNIIDYMQFFDQSKGRMIRESGIPFSELRPGKPAEATIDERLILMA